jgi:hypothetical protein
MIHVRIDNHHSTALDIYVNISPKQNSIISSTPILSNDEHIYDRLFDTKNFPLRQSKIVQNRMTDINPFDKKHYTLQQILDNVETIQQQYEQVINHRKTSTPSCFFTFKQVTKILKNLRKIKTKTNTELMENTYSEKKSPFIFGGETLQWIALPQDDDNHIYENEFIQ